MDKREHDKLIQVVRELQKKFDDGEAMLTIQVLTFLFDWLFNHIMQVDKKLAGAIQDAK